MKTPTTPVHETYPDPHHNPYSRTVFGFWLYLMSDFILFGALFAAYAVLRNATFGGPTGKELFQPTFTLVQTLILLTCSLTVGLAGASAHRKHKFWTIALFGLTFLLGTVFIGMELTEFSRLLNAGHGWDKSAFLSMYFTIIGTHAVHVMFGLLWILILLVPVWQEGISHVSIRRLTCLKMFWQFLNIIWIFIFSFVYLMEVA
jgi:cytochrome o ubiquinol oxidase subunit III